MCVADADYGVVDDVDQSTDNLGPAIGGLVTVRLREIQQIQRKEPTVSLTG